MTDKEIKKIVSWTKRSYNMVNDLSSPGGNYNYCLFSDKIKLNWFKNFDKHNVILLGKRQCGKTLALCAYAIWFAAFNSNVRVTCSSYNKAMTNDMITTIKKLLSTMPNSFQTTLTYKSTKTCIKFNNGSSIMALNIHSRMKDSYTIDCMLIDELAYWQYSKAVKFIKTYFPMQSNKKMLIASTAGKTGTLKKPNYFYKLFTEKNSFKKITYVLSPILERKTYEDFVDKFGVTIADCELCGKFIKE